MMRIFLNFALWSIRREKNNLRFYSEQDDKGLNIIRSESLVPEVGNKTQRVAKRWMSI